MSRVKEESDIVAPGDTLTEEDDVRPGDGVFQENGKIISKYIGSVRYDNGYVNVTPMSGRYIPSEGDIVIGEVEHVSYNNWKVSLASPYEGMLRIDTAVDEYIDLDEDDLTDYYDVGDAIVVKVTSVNAGMDVNLSMMDKRCRKLEGGRIIQIPPSKVPRVIGKQGTMVKQIKEQTGCKIIVGQNGQVWIRGEKENLAARAVKKVEREAHQSGLTDKIGEWLEEQR